MSMRTNLIVAALSSAAILPAIRHEAAAAQPGCILAEHKVLSVKAYCGWDERYDGSASSQELRGAEVFVQAEAGLNAPWLQLQLEGHIGEMKGPAAMPACPLKADVRVRVMPSGPGFWVQLIAPDSKSGEEVLRRARLLLR